MQVANNVALITGGGSGLGEATARRLAEGGARVAILDIDIKSAQTVADDIGGIAIQSDVSDEIAVETALTHIIDILGSAPQIVINCAGIGAGARIVGREGKLSIDLFQKILQVNLFGTFHVMSHCARHMMELDLIEGDERGVIINTSSVAWEDGQLGQAAYAASKGAISSLCLPAAREFAQSAIRVMAIAPGLFQAPMMDGLPEEVSLKIIANVPFPKRLGSADEYAMLAEHIINNSYLNGSTIRLDGAVRLPPR
jgi:NAD(P)-dependent dehydrogenase (short-subunit alcohol dehydrogenase family)